MIVLRQLAELLASRARIGSFGRRAAASLGRRARLSAAKPSPGRPLLSKLGSSDADADSELCKFRPISKPIRWLREAAADSGQLAARLPATGADFLFHENRTNKMSPSRPPAAGDTPAANANESLIIPLKGERAHSDPPRAPSAAGA